MNINHHEQQVLARLQDGRWLTQSSLRTSRQTLNKLVCARLIDQKLNSKKISFLPETGMLYRLRVAHVERALMAADKPPTEMPPEVPPQQPSELPPGQPGELPYQEPPEVSPPLEAPPMAPPLTEPKAN